ncbi:MAG: OadG family protein [Paludibacteraceae bacterium]|nr:OadG family protein [Paludibacteraceae bacterium]
MENLIYALELMGIGMGTVFVVLILVIELGKLLILLVNKIAPEEAKPQAKSATPVAVMPNVAQAIAKAINTITEGKGKVEKIEKQ